MIVKCLDDCTYTTLYTSCKAYQGERYAVIEEKEHFYFLELGNFKFGWFPKSNFEVETK